VPTAGLIECVNSLEKCATCAHTLRPFWLHPTSALGLRSAGMAYTRPGSLPAHLITVPGTCHKSGSPTEIGRADRYPMPSTECREQMSVQYSHWKRDCFWLWSCQAQMSPTCAERRVCWSSKPLVFAIERCPPSRTRLGRAFQPVALTHYQVAPPNSHRRGGLD
jgi:hypothetical protein